MADTPANANSHSALVNQLCRLVDTIRENNNAENRRTDRLQPQETTSVAISRLFPSVNGNTRLTNTTGTSSSTSGTHFEALENTPQFLPKRINESRKGKRKKPYTKKKDAQSSSVMKDVFLLPSPRMKNVPRGRKREELYARGFVATAFTITNDMSNAELIESFSSIFSEKLRGFRKFTIVRGIGNKIVEINTSQEINGKVLKHICGQGPIYLRCVRAMDSDFLWVDGDEDSNSDVDKEASSIKSDDEDLHVPVVLPISSVPSTSECNIPRVNLTPVINTRNALSPLPIRDMCTPTSSQTPSGTVQVEDACAVACPTCNMRFPVGQIEQHADDCCEGRTAEASLYETLVLDSIDLETIDMPDENAAISEIESESSTTASAKELIGSLLVNLNSSPNRITVRRKYLWDDFTVAQKKPWFIHNAIYKIDFIGEPAVDGGGPRREFFTGIVLPSLLNDMPMLLLL